MVLVINKITFAFQFKHLDPIQQLDVCVDMVTCKTKVSVEAVAKASALVTDTTIGTRCLFPVYIVCWESIFSFDSARNISLACVIVHCQHVKLRLSTVLTLGPVDELQQFLLSGVVAISEIDFNFWACLFGTVLLNINLDLRDCEIGQCLQRVLNRIGIFEVLQSGCVNLDGTSIVLATELVNKTELKESHRRPTFVVAGQFLEVVATVRLTVSLRVIAFRALAERAIVSFVTSIAMALLILEPWPVNAPRRSAVGLGIIGNVCSECCSGSLPDVVERVGIGTALSVSAAVIGACSSAASFTSEGREALALASGTVAQTASSTLAVRVLVVESCVLGVLPRFFIGILRTFGVVRSLKTSR